MWTAFVDGKCFKIIIPTNVDPRVMVITSKTNKRKVQLLKVSLGKTSRPVQIQGQRPSANLGFLKYLNKNLVFLYVLNCGQNLLKGKFLKKDNSNKC